jgi:DNA-binding response OmpR family regulator
VTGYKIHIIDDDPATHEILGDYLTLAGFQVNSAYDGHAGLELMRNDPPDLVLLDIQMPELDGFGLLKMVGDDDLFQDVPILIITSLQRTNLKIKGLELGADDFIVKPFERAELFARIKVALRRSRRFGRTAGVLDGCLDDISIAELLQTLDINKKTAQVLFPEMAGELFTEGGQLLSARQGNFHGDAAMDRLMLLHQGTFTVRFGRSPENRGQDDVSIQHQLLKTLICLDTLKELLPGSPEPNPKVSWLPDGLDFSERDRLEKLLPLPLYELLALLPGDLTVNAELFAQSC